MNNNKHYRNWMIQAPLGLVILGFGVCLVAESAILKASGASWMQWVPAGTVSLCVFNSGLCIFGNSILERVRYERENEGKK
ncbi:hypothetical protein [Haliscomenobacter sp.]|uniref:hypothetical protein n=1 Tax=Haliscomenobacter sp. TaxID=2717303 RepID=UPI003364CDD0